MEENEYSAMCTFLTQTSPSVISANASTIDMLPFFTDLTSVPSSTTPHSYVSSTK